MINDNINSQILDEILNNQSIPKDICQKTRLEIHGLRNGFSEIDFACFKVPYLNR